MKQIKPVLQKLYRSAQFFNETDRTQYIRMDGNESVDGLPKDFVKSVLNKVTPAMLATYPNPKKCTEAVANYLGVDREMVFMTNGSDAAIKMFFEVYIGEGDKVIIASPAFEMYEVYCNMFGAKAINIAYGESFEFPMDSYLAEIEKGAKLAIITNPNNPTGSVIAEDEIVKILEKAKENDTLVMIDEAYYWIYDKTMLGLLDKYPNMVLLRTFSKILGLAGIRLGFAVANQDMIMDLKKVAAPAGVNTVALLFGEELMNHPEIIESLVDDFRKDKQYLLEELKKANIEYLDTESNYVLIPAGDNYQMILDSLKEDGLLIAYKMNKYFRINIGGKESTDRFIDSFVSACSL